MPDHPPEIITQWKASLSRENIEDRTKIYVCLKHIRKEVEMHFSIPQPLGTTLDAELSIPRLHKAAVPKFYQVVRIIHFIYIEIELFESLY